MKDKVLADLIAAQRDLLNRSTELLRQAMRQCTMYQQRCGDLEREREELKAERDKARTERDKAMAEHSPQGLMRKLLEERERRQAVQKETERLDQLRKPKRRGRTRTKPVEP